MVFSSIEFLWYFFPVVLGLYFLVPPAWRNGLLAISSLVFYAWGAHAVVFVFMASIALNFSAGLGIGHFRDRGRIQAANRLKIAAVTVDLAILFTWKYTVFAANSLDHVIGIFGNKHAIPLPSITLPIGISFFTFHAISYVVDTNRGSAPPMRNPLNFTQYMAFFPQLIAGPIIRYHEIQDQIHHPPPRSQRFDDFAQAFPRFALGLAKKVLIADQVGPIADATFAHPHTLTSASAWLGALAYTVQIYFDFSGYTDMAIAMGRMFGFQFPENFNRPYSSLSVTDFWRRWHMSLSRFFRDYVYIPIGGNRGTQRRTCMNLLFVFLLTGAWHGAAWTFVLWGFFYGVLLVIERLTGISRLADDVHPVVRRVITLLLVICGWVMFRASSVGGAIGVYKAMIPHTFGPLTPAVHTALTRETVAALVIGCLSFLLPRKYVTGRILVEGEWRGWTLALRAAAIVALPLAAIFVAAGSFSPFLYFRF